MKEKRGEKRGVGRVLKWQSVFHSKCEFINSGDTYEINNEM